MQHQLLIRFSIIAGVILSIFGTACQESKGRKFEQGNVIGTYSQSQIINESIEPFLSSDQYETAVDELGKLTPLAYFEKTFTGLAIGNIVIDSETLEISEDEIFGLKEHYTKLNLSYNSMAQMWDENNFNPYVLTSSDFKNAMSVSLEAISGAYYETDEYIPEDLSLLGIPNPVPPVIAAVKMCQVARRCKDNPGQAVKELVNLENWKLIAEHQRTASLLAGIGHRIDKYQDKPFADASYNIGKAMIACAPKVVGVAKFLGASLTTLIDEDGEEDCEENY